MKAIPGPKNLNESGFPAGSLVLYEHDGSPYIALCLGVKKQNYALLNMRGRELDLPAKRLQRLPGLIPETAATQKSRAEFLEEFYETCRKNAADFKLEEIWSFVGEDSKEFTCAELAELYFGQSSPEQYLSLYLGLLSDRLYFKRTNFTFMPRSAESVAELRKGELARESRLRLHDTLIEAFAGRINDPKHNLPSEVMPLLHLLEDVAAETQHLDNARHKEAKEIINLCAEKLHLQLSGSVSERALQILDSISHFSPDTNLSIIRHQYPRNFSAQALLEAKDLVVPNRLAEYPDAGLRVDLTALECITIDDATTQDMDDALSLEIDGGQMRLGVHISDVASLVEINSGLDKAGFQRGTSLYFPDGVRNMLPEELANNKLSLRPGEVRPSLSCIFEFDTQREIRSSTIVPSIIRVKRRYNYAEVDELLETDTDILHKLYNLSSQLQAGRLARGAVQMLKREAIVVRTPSGELVLQEIDEQSPSRSLVGEFMILANRTMAQFGVDHKLPLLYRGQAAAEVEENQTSANAPEEGMASEYAARSKLKKSLVSITPQPHASLGLKAYIQATSPIRRYADLMNQRQIIAQLKTGRTNLSAQALLECLSTLETRLAAANAINKESRRFWYIRYLEQFLGQARIYRATVLRTDLRNPLVQLDEIFMTTIIKTTKSLKPGDEIQLKLIAADARADLLRLEVI